MKDRTIWFYEIVTVAEGQATRTRQLDWDGALADVARVPVAQRTVEGDSQLVGSIATYNMQDHLLLHRVKDGGEWLSVMNWDTGDLRELEQSEREGYPDTSVVCFLPFGNIVGMMQGARSAPPRRVCRPG
ncbi:hypothetical protein [Streptomyces sp. 1222.2]|uniref:hypothetical protein n=1 Tax=Streptomyces sp. 1222.2 TaxID=1938833 RepID=UPI00211BDCBD|nr:hypothetical protein [Streptomyces sp. 1222.2]